MDVFLLIGTALGAAIGLVHAAHIFRTRRAEGHAGIVGALWFSLWALGLWTLFGAYVLFFWIVGAAGMAASRIPGVRRAPQ